jgi:hypothetical protein
MPRRIVNDPRDTKARDDERGDAEEAASTLTITDASGNPVFVGRQVRGVTHPSPVIPPDTEGSYRVPPGDEIVGTADGSELTGE